MHRYSVFLGFALFLFSCGRNSVPEGIIKQDKMAALLVDLHLVDGSVSMASQPDTINKYAFGLYKAVFQKHQVDTAVFRKSFKYYSEHPILMDKIYDGVLKNLQTRQDSAIEKNRLGDSVRAARAGDSIRLKMKRDSANEQRKLRDSVRIKRLPPVKKPGEKRPAARAIKQS